MAGSISPEVTTTVLRQISEREMQAALEFLPTERLFREYLHRVIDRTHTANGRPNAALVAELLEEFSQ
jgi:hypothetical protein